MSRFVVPIGEEESSSSLSSRIYLSSAESLLNNFFPPSTYPANHKMLPIIF